MAAVKSSCSQQKLLNKILHWDGGGYYYFMFNFILRTNKTKAALQKYFKTAWKFLDIQ